MIGVCRRRSFYSTGTICSAFPEKSIEDFALELLAIRKKETGILLGVFNNIALFIHSGDTEQDIIEQYNEKRGKLK